MIRIFLTVAVTLLVLIGVLVFFYYRNRYLDKELTELQDISEKLRELITLRETVKRQQEQITILQKKCEDCTNL